MRGKASEHLHGVVSRAELLAAGVGKRAIEHRLKTGRLFTKYRGVYAVGRQDLTIWGQRRAVVLACGKGAVLSHRSAAGAWGLRPDGRPRWEVIVPSARTPTAQVDTYEYRMQGFEHTTLEGVAITTPMRTLLDLSSVIGVHQLRRAIERAVEHELFDLGELERVMAVHPRWPGTPALRTLLADFHTHGLTRTRSDLESAFLQLCIDHGLPRPTINRATDGREIDATWPGSNLIVEIDSWQHHRHRRAFAIDRAKDRAALRVGRRTARFTGDEIDHAPARVAAELRELI